MPRLNLHQGEAGEPDAPPELGPAEALQPLLVSIRDLTRLLARSEIALHRDDAAGRLPKPIRLGGSKRWRLADVQEWVRLGCPSRAEYEARRAK